ncbi:MAG: hypothetical protein ACOY4U_00540 [Pseudomonadota bacterium]
MTEQLLGGTLSGRAAPNGSAIAQLTDNLLRLPRPRHSIPHSWPNFKQILGHQEGADQMRAFTRAVIQANRRALGGKNGQPAGGANPTRSARSAIRTLVTAQASGPSKPCGTTTDV